MKKWLNEAEKQHNGEIQAMINALNSNSDNLERQIAAEEKNFEAHKDDLEWMKTYGDCSQHCVEELRKEVIWNFFRVRQLKKELI